jgi:outer membrane scaffolding protein for murein synthesis (MipA/OmpV family)
MSCRRLSLGAFVLSSCLSGAALAAGGTIFIDPPPEQAYTLSLGPTLWMFPSYPGGRRLQTVLFPGVDFYAANGLFASTDNGIGWNLSSRSDLQAGLRLWAQLGRKARDSRRLAGTDDIGPRLEKGGFVNFAPYDFLLLQSSVRYGSGVRGDGLLAEVAVTTGLPLGDKGSLAFSLGTTWANQAYRQSYFGLTEEQALRSNRAPWQMSSGQQDTNLGVSGEYRLDPDWRLSGQWIHAHLLGDAARSPVVERASQSTVSLTLWRRFK